MTGEILIRFDSRWARRNEFADAIWYGKEFRGDCLQNFLKSTALLCPTHRCGRDLSIATQCVRVVEAANGLRNRFRLIAVVKINGDKHVLQLCHGSSFWNVVLSEALQCCRPNPENVLQLANRIFAVIPQVRVRTGATGRPRILVRKKGESPLRSVFDDFVQGRVFVGAGREIGIAILSSDLIPIANSGRVSLGKVHRAVSSKFYPGMRVIHHRRAALGAGDVVVLQSQGVANFVSGELSQARKRGLQHARVRLLSVLVGSEQPFEDHVVLPHAERTQRNLSLNDLAGPRINNSSTIRPAASRTMDPVDHVVANIHWISAWRKHFNLKGVSISRGFKGLVPPAGAVQQGRTDGLWSSRIEIVDDRFYWIADRSRRIFLLQTMAGDIALHNWRSDRRGVIHVLDGEEARTRIEFSGMIISVRKLNERVMLAHGNRVWIGYDFLNELSRLFANKGQSGFHFCILRKVLRIRQIDRRTRGIQVKRALFRLLQRFYNVMCITGEEEGSINQNVVTVFRGNRKTPNYRLCKSILYGLLLSAIVAASAKPVIYCCEQDFRTTTLELNNAFFA